MTDKTFLSPCSLCCPNERECEPVLALTEAIRVARYGLILGVINRQSILGRQLEREGGPLWRAAGLFKLSELVQVVRHVAG